MFNNYGSNCKVLYNLLKTMRTKNLTLKTVYKIYMRK